MSPANPYAPAPKKARLEIIPLIDVIFFLLATFVLFTLSLNKIKSIEVPFPVPGREGSIEDEMLYLQATEGDNYFWKVGAATTPELITAAELSPRLVDYKTRIKNPRVFIRGDNKATFGHMIAALDAVRLQKIEQVSVETMASPSGK